MNDTTASFKFIPNPTGAPLDDKSFVSSALAQQKQRDADGYTPFGLFLIIAAVAIILIAWRMR